jgi:NAD(P)-dependent dehydrogenase (short-subunit alcohol dehydrogenase family)
MKMLITGASRGIGLAEAQKFSSEELFLVGTSTTSFEEKGFEHHHCYGVNLAIPKEIDDLVDRVVADTPSLDVLVNNVGVMVLKRFEEMKDEDMYALLDINLRSHLLLTRKLLPLLRKGKNPHIIFMSSMAAKSSIVGESVYSATKAAVTAFANVLRNELSPGVKVSVIHSWGVDTWNPEPKEGLLRAEQVADVLDFIVTREPNFLVESIDLSDVSQWRGAEAPWSP